jgi:hypothetical protein
MHKRCFISLMVLISAVWCAAARGEDLPATRTVKGTRIGHYTNGAVPVDLSTTTIAAYIPSGSGYTVITGTGTSSGTFTIANVPTGFFWLQFGTNYLWTSNSTVDADFYSGNRSDVVAADPSTTLFTFDLANLNSWQSTDALETVCTNNNSFDFFFGTVGETTFTGTFNYFGNLSDASKGDQYYAEQLITQSVAGYPFTALGRFIAPPKFTQANGSDTSINGTLLTVPQTHSFEANINGADLLAQALAANPGATLSFSDFALDVYPGSFAHGQTTATPDLIIYGGIPTISTNGDLGPVLYGNPYPASKWPLFVIYGYFATTNYTAPGAASSTTILTGAFGNTTSLPSITSPIKPLVGVPQSPTVNGKNFFTNHRGVGLTPLLKWSAPAVGTATFYTISVFQLINSGGSTIAQGVANLATQKTSFRIPTGLLTTGQAYVFAVQAAYVPGLNFAKNPYFGGPTEGFADIISGMMQP